MRKKFLRGAALIMCLLCALSLVACAEGVSYKDRLDEYVANNADGKDVPEYRDGFAILQLTDIHWSTGTQVGNDDYGQARYIKKLVEEAKRHSGGKIDLIEVTGDTFMLSNRRTVEAFINTMEEIGIPYAMTWGNHDRQGSYNPTWISEMFLEAEHCLYTEVAGDDLEGSSNYVINLDKGGETKWQIFHLDSGASYRDGADDIFLTYEYVRQEQLDWMDAMHKNGVPSLAYYHIAQKDHEIMFDNVLAGNEGYSAKFFKFEGFASSKAENTPPLEDAFVKNNIKGAFIGHSHSNDLTMTTANGIVYGFGVKTGTELYYESIEQSELVEGENVFGMDEFLDFDEDFDLVGASLVTLHDDGTFELEHVYYNERTTGDLVKWVKY